MERPVRKFRLSVVVFAGLAGGAAEILWVALYAAFTEASGMEIARQVAASVVPGAAEAAYGPALGIATHLILSLVVAAAFALAVWVPYARRKPALTMASAVGALAVVWAVNFFLVLPALNPTFVELMPYAATLLSKLLFGAAMGWALARAGVPRGERGAHAPARACSGLGTRGALRGRNQPSKGDPPALMEWSPPTRNGIEVPKWRW